ncbi:hypothetical protein [Halorussus halobius]|uniref:hypothetical protein n=1 Tax=Halorussus halobius TaxID=1710537 RepID=UPI0010918F76|nr:hypothetical protein [Halorussus halobius]
MYEPLVDVSSELLSVVAYGLGTLTLSLFGFAVEYNGIQQLLSGEQLLGAWYAYVGLLALVAATKLGREKLLASLAS